MQTPDCDISTNWFGKHTAKYPCPHCDERLCSPLADAGTSDECPFCRNIFTVPGATFLSQVRGAKEASKARAAKEKTERQNAKVARKQQAAGERLKARQQVVAQREVRERAAEDESKRRADEATTAVTLSGQSAGKRQPMLSGAAVVVLIAIALAYWAIRGSDLRSKLDLCESKDVVTAKVSYSGLFSNDTVVFDLRGSGGAGARRIDAVHLLMQFVDKLNSGSIRKVVLARNGRDRFYASHSDLRPLADSYSADGRIWAFNNLPSKVRRMDGTAAFGEWSGGWLGVMKEQTEDLNKLLTQWLD